MLASENGSSWSCLEPQLALTLARAARDTLMAEEKTARLRIRECEDMLATLKDSLDDAQARVTDSHQQIASILTFIDQQGIRINLRPLNFEGVQDHTTSSDMDSDSDSYPCPSNPDEDADFLLS